MGQYNVGLKTLSIADYNPTTGALTNLVALEVYRDTLVINEEPPTKTKHYQAGKSSPRKISVQGGSEMAKFSVMDTDPDTLEILFGGDVTTLDGKKKWQKAEGAKKEIIKGLVVETNDGYKYTITRGSWTAVPNYNLGETGIALIDVEVEATDTNLTNIPSVTWEQV